MDKNHDVDAALRLSRIYIYNGAEPYAPAIMSFVRMIKAYREELSRDIERQLEVPDAELRGATERMLRNLRETK